MKKLLVLSYFLSISALVSNSQSEKYEADGASVQAITKALYDVISGPSGQPRDWERFQHLFAPQARLIPTRKEKDGTFTVKSISPEEYSQLFQTNMTKPFFEKEVHQVSEEYGTIAHVFSTYETAEKLNGPATNRGINSIQLFKDQGRYFIVSVFWCAESMGFPIPEKYLN